MPPSKDADLVISAVTAASSAEVAGQAGKAMRAGQIFLDINSCSPATKRSNSQAVQSSGADYVEAAVMAPVPPQRLKVPMLLGGRRAAELAPVLWQSWHERYIHLRRDRCGFRREDVPKCRD